MITNNVITGSLLAIFNCMHSVAGSPRIDVPAYSGMQECSFPIPICVTDKDKVLNKMGLGHFVVVRH